VEKLETIGDTIETIRDSWIFVEIDWRYWSLVEIVGYTRDWRLGAAYRAAEIW
jgi:hypothetical protein